MISKTQKDEPQDISSLTQRTYGNETSEQSRPYWFQILEDTKVKDIIKPRKLVKVQFAEEVGTIIEKLAAANVLSAVVIDEDRNLCYGFVDVLDLMGYALEVSSWSNDITREVINVKWEAQCFSRQTSGNLTNFSQRNPFKTVTYSSSLMEVAKLFGEGIHRVAVMNQENQRIENVISQSDLIRFLTKRGSWIGSKIEKPLFECDIFSSNVTWIKHTETAIQAFKLMKEKGFSGLPIIDDNLRLIANISATDLKGLNEEKFQYIKLPVHDFLKKLHGFPKAPVYVRPEDTVETLMLKFVVHKVHRIYIVDPSMKPTGVITLTDLIRFFLGVNPHTQQP